MTHLPPTAERLALLDSLRALALFGVILMNMGATVMRFAGADVMASAGTADFAVMGVDLVFVLGKARSAFAFLFGLGFAILMLRADARGGGFGRFYVRRMMALLAFGVFNQLFLFWGDILVTYALLGLLLLSLRDWPDRAMLRAGLVLVIAPPLLAGLIEAATGRALPALLAADPEANARLGAIYAGSDYLAVIMANAPQPLMRWANQTAHVLVYDIGLLGLFLLGAWTARKGVHLDIAAHRALLRRVMLWFGPAGLLLCIGYATRFAGYEPEGVMRGVLTAAYAGLPLLALAYLAGLALLFARRGARFQALLAPAGRMALTNYLASGAIGGWLFYGYGLGLMNHVGILAINGIAVALFAALLLFSHLWLARFRLGPAEWLWRSASYRAWQPLRRRPATDRPATPALAETG